MDKSEIAEKYRISIDGADDYFKIKCVAVLDTIVDSLDEEIQYQIQKEIQQNEQKHYKGTAVDVLGKK